MLLFALNKTYPPLLVSQENILKSSAGYIFPIPVKWMYLFIRSGFLRVFRDIFSSAEGSSDGRPESDPTVVSAFV